MHVYTDGSCINNGGANARAGYAVYFGEDDKRNEYAQVIGQQTNNTGELTGFIRAVELCKDMLDSKQLVNIHTDSEYVIKCVSSYGQKLALNNWKTSTGKLPPNKDLVEKAYTLYQTYKANIQIHHVKAHTANDDEHSLGNREADRLANLAVGIIAEEKPSKYYIDISFSKKERAKELGAKWDVNAKKWYFMDDIDEENKEQLKRLEHETIPVKESKTSKDEQKHYVKIAFKDKNTAKKLGARWDATIKSWYYTDELKQDNIEKLINLCN